MKLPLITALGAISLLAGCASQHDAIPGAPEPNAALAQRSGKPLAQLQQGYSVYMLKCGECHERKLPSQVTGAQWHRVVPGMAWNAGLTRADEAAVLAYVTAAATAGR